MTLAETVALVGVGAGGAAGGTALLIRALPYVLHAFADAYKRKADEKARLAEAQAHRDDTLRIAMISLQAASKSQDERLSAAELRALDCEQAHMSCREDVAEALSRADQALWAATSVQERYDRLAVRLGEDVSDIEPVIPPPGRPK